MSDKDQEIQRLQAENARLQKELQQKLDAIAALYAERDSLTAKKAELEDALTSLKAQIAWLRRKVFGSSMSEKLPKNAADLEPTLFDTQLPEEEQEKLDAEVKEMEERNAKLIEVKAHRREIRKPVLSGTLPVKENHIYPEGVKDNPDYVEIGTEVTDKLAVIPGQLYVQRDVRHKFFEAQEEDKKHASEALVYIGKLYEIEEEMREAGLDADAIRERRQKESYPIIQDFENWMNTVSGGMSSKSLIGQAVAYANVLLPRLSRYVLDGRYNIDNNGVENAIRPLALGRKNYLFAGNHAAAVRSAIAYSMIASCKAVGVDVRSWLVDVLGRIPTHKGLWRDLLPAHWAPTATDCK